MNPERVNLTQPIGPISSVTVQIPAKAEWDTPPPGAEEAIWNMRSIGLSVEQALQLHDDDVEKIGAAFARANVAWNGGQRAIRAGGA